MKNSLEIKNLHISIEGKEIVKGVDLEIKKGEIVALMGPNGSGKSTLASVLLGHPNYKVIKGKIIYKGKDITKLSPDKRAKLGLFLGFQYPQELPGVSVSNFLRTALNSLKKKKTSVPEFMNLLKEKMKLLKIDEKFALRYLNEGFSGGEKKRMEILQMAVLEPEIAILDEIDSGLDIDALKIVAKGINKLMNPNMGVLIITHYQRILNHINPDKVHIMIDGKIVKTGTKELAEHLEEHGYEFIND